MNKIFSAKMPANVGGSQFYSSLIRPPNKRTNEDVNIIYTYLRKLEVFDRLHDDPLRSVCRTARLEKRPANYILYKKGQVATCWYILLAGSVIMDKQVYLPIGCIPQIFIRVKSLIAHRTSLGNDAI